jgi:hypothetical protein
LSEEAAMDDELIADLIAAIEAARADGGGQLLVANVKARLHAARIFVGRVEDDWD